MIAGILKQLFGDKSTKDRKEYQPIIDQVNTFLGSVQALSDDELRGKTAQFQERVKVATQSLEDELKQLNVAANDVATEIHLKEELYEKIDKLSKSIDEKIEEEQSNR